MTTPPADAGAKRLSLLGQPGFLRSPERIVPSPDGVIIIAWLTEDGRGIAFECELDAGQMQRALNALPEVKHGD